MFVNNLLARVTTERYDGNIPFRLITRTGQFQIKRYRNRSHRSLVFVPNNRARGHSVRPGQYWLGRKNVFSLSLSNDGTWNSNFIVIVQRQARNKLCRDTRTLIVRIAAVGRIIISFRRRGFSVSVRWYTKCR